MKLTVTLNGTSKNPWHAMGLKQNPFPQIPKAEYTSQCLHLQALGGDPIPNAQYIRNHLAGWDPDFVELCVSKFVKGKITRFEVTWEV